MRRHSDGKIRILRIQSRICVGGPALNTIMLSAHLNRDRFDTLLVGGRLDPGEESLTPWAEGQGVKLHIIDSMGRSIHWWDDFRALIQLIRLMRNFKPHIVHTHTAKAGALGRLAAWLCHVPVRVHTFHGHVFQGYFHPVINRLVIWAERALAKISSSIIAISEHQYDDLVKRYRIVSERNCRIIRLGFDLAPLSQGSPGRFKTRLGLPKSTLLAGIIARLAPVKNHHLFLRGIAAWVKKQVGWSPAELRFLIIGDGGLRTSLEALARDLGIDEWVVFTGWQTDMPSVYRDLSLNVLVSRNEGTPVTLIEGISAGVPFLTTDVGGIRDFASPQAGTILPDNTTPERIRDELMRLFVSKSGPPRVSNRIRQEIDAQFGIQRLLREVESLYTELLKHQGVDPPHHQAR